MRLNGARVHSTSQPVKAGDVVTIALDRTVRVLKVLGFSERRGDSDAARLIAEDLTPASTRNPAPQPEPVAARDPGAGRPTKRDRRALDRWRTGDDGA